MKLLAITVKKAVSEYPRISVLPRAILRCMLPDGIM
jgi:hypothetical protein